MNISLDPNLEKFIYQEIEEGYYNSVSEVIRDALSILIEKDTLFKQQVDRLDQEISLGFYSFQKPKLLKEERSLKR